MNEADRNSGRYGNPKGDEKIEIFSQETYGGPNF